MSSSNQNTHFIDFSAPKPVIFILLTNDEKKTMTLHDPACGTVNRRRNGRWPSSEIWEAPNGIIPDEVVNKFGDCIVKRHTCLDANMRSIIDSKAKQL